MPSPAGFTTDGIPYYDIVSFMSQKGVLLFSKNLGDVKSEYDTRNEELDKLIYDNDVQDDVEYDVTTTKNIRSVFANLNHKIPKSLQYRGMTKRIGRISRVHEFSNISSIPADLSTLELQTGFGPRGSLDIDPLIYSSFFVKVKTLHIAVPLM